MSSVEPKQTLHFHSCEWNLPKVTSSTSSYILGGLVIAASIVLLVLRHDHIHLPVGPMEISSHLLDSFLVGGLLLLPGVCIALYTKYREQRFKRQILSEDNGQKAIRDNFVLATEDKSEGYSESSKDPIKVNGTEFFIVNVVRSSRLESHYFPNTPIGRKRLSELEKTLL